MPRGNARDPGAAHACSGAGPGGRDAGRLVVSLGWSFRATVPRGSIAAVAAVPWRRLSIGAHGWRGRWLVNTAAGPLVRVTIEPPVPARVLGVPIRLRELTLSIDDVDAFLTELR